MSNWSIKINRKVIDKQSGCIWYTLHVRGVNPRLLDMEIRHIFGADRILNIAHETEKKVLVLVEK